MRANTANEIESDIRDGISKGRYKNCINLSVRLVETIYGEDYFQTSCEEKSLLPNEKSPNCNCPAMCHYFQDRAEIEEQNAAAEKVQIRKERVWRIAKYPFEFLGIAFNGFIKLASPVQFLIVLLLILIFAPQWVPRIIELIRAVKDVPK